MTRTGVLTLASAAALLIAASGSALAAAHSVRPGAQAVRVSTVDFDGWSGCAKIDNGLVEAIVAPQIGRIMAFEFDGDAASNVLFVNRALEGKTAASAALGKGNWANFGGEKVWPSPQSRWPHYIGATWPPDTQIDGSAYRITRVPGGVRMVSPASRAFGLRIVRTIVMRAGRPSLDIVNTFRWLPARASSGKIGIWSVAQTRPDGTIVAPTAPAERALFPAGFVTFDADSRPIVKGAILPPGWSAANGALIGRRDPKQSHKVGMADSAAWIASLYRGRTLFIERFAHAAPAAQQPDDGCRAEVYTNGGALGYIEIEGLGPLTAPKPGKSSVYTMRWTLARLPSAPVGSRAISSAVLRAAAARSGTSGN